MSASLRCWTSGFFFLPPRSLTRSVRVVAVSKPLVQQRDDVADIGFRADQATGGLHDAVHAGVEIGIRKAAGVFVVVIGTDSSCSKSTPGQARTDDDHANEHVTRIIHALSESPP